MRERVWIAAGLCVGALLAGCHQTDNSAATTAITPAATSTVAVPAAAATAASPNTVQLVLRGPNDCTAEPWKRAINLDDTVAFVPAPPIAGTIVVEAKDGAGNKLHFPDHGVDKNRFEAPETTPPAKGSPGDYWRYKVTFTPTEGKPCVVDPVICLQGAGNCKTENDQGEDDNGKKPQATPTPH